MIINLNMLGTRIHHRISSQTSHTRIVVEDEPIKKKKKKKEKKRNVVEDDKSVKKRNMELMKQRLDMSELNHSIRLCV